VGSDDLGLNEAPKAREVAYHIGIPHHEIMVDAAAALALVPTLAKVFDEPFADASAIPTYLIAQKAREHVTVALSGDGGDEGFGGYARHIFAAMLDERLSAVPRPLQALGGAALDLFSTDAIDNVLGAIKGQTQSAFIRRLTGGRIKGLARYLSSGQSGDLYDRLRRQWPDISDMLRAPIEPEMTQLPKAARLDSSMMAADMVGYLPADVLVKVDRATMAHGLEAREPLLDHNLLAFAASLPAHLRITGGKGKRALAAVLHRHVPEALVDRPKQGFSVPMDQWLRGPLRAWADEMLNDPSLATSGLFNVPRLREIFAAHQSGRIDRQHQLWNALMLISWLKARRLI
jgi:asparagine synthase (glutamine-hydrolysing)